VSNDFCCPRTGEAGQGQHLKNFPRLAPKQAAKRKGVLGVRVPREFLPACCPTKQDCGFLPAAAGGGLIVRSGFVSWICGLNSAK